MFCLIDVRRYFVEFLIQYSTYYYEHECNSNVSGTNVAFRKPVNQSSTTRAGPASMANDGKLGNENPDEQQCSETQKEPSPWWRVDLLSAQTVRVVRITTRSCCGHQPIQDLEIRVGNSSADLQRNPLCAWYPGTLGKR